MRLRPVIELANTDHRVSRREDEPGVSPDRGPVIGKVFHLAGHSLPNPFLVIEGFRDRDKFVNDPDFAGLQENEVFQTLLATEYRVL